MTLDFKALRILIAAFLAAILVWALPAHAAPFAYISNYRSNSVSVINTATNTVVATVPVGRKPYGVAVNSAGTRAYVTNQSDGSVSVIDTATNAVVATVPVGTDPWGVAVNPAGTFAYVAEGINNIVSVINTATNTVVATVPVGLSPGAVAVHPAGTFVYVANVYSYSVSVIDAATNSVVATVPVGLDPYSLAVNPAGTFVYVANLNGYTYSVIATATNTVVATVPVIRPYGVAVHPAGTFVYVANLDGNNVLVINTATNTVVATVPVGIFPRGIAVNPAGTFVYVANTNSANVSVINTATNAVVATVPVGNSPVAFGLFIGGPSATVPGAPTIGTATPGSGQGTVAFTPPAWNGDSPVTGYTVTSNPGGITASGAASPITVAGLTSGTAYTFTVTATNAVGTGPASAPSNAVTPSAAAPSLTLMPPSLTFAARMTATPSPAQTVTLTNNGPGTLSIGSITVSGDFAFTSACPASLASGATCMIDVTFTPLTNGRRTGALTVASIASGSPHSVTLSGPAMAPPTFFVAAAGNVLPGQKFPIGIRIFNPAGNPLSYSDFSATLTYPTGFVNAAPDISYPQGGCRGVDYFSYTGYTGGVQGGNTIGFAGGGVVIPNSLCTRVQVQVMAPAAPGTYTFTIPAGGFTIASPFAYSNPSPITATVVVAPAATAAPSITLTPPAHIFASRPVSTLSPAQTVTLTNNGPGTLSIGSITVSGDFAFTSACASLAAGATCTLDVTFTPLATGIRTGAVTVTSNATGSPHTVALSGIGQGPFAPVMQVVPALGAFAPQELGTGSPAQLFVITNVGNATLSFSDISVSGAGFTLLATVTGTTYERCGAAIASGSVCAVQVTFNPAAEGPVEGVLHIAGNATNSLVDVRLVASGVITVPPRALSVPASLAFPEQPVGTRSAGRAVTITNTSSSVVSVSELSAGGDFSVSDTCTSIAAHGNCAPLVFFRPTAIGERSAQLTIRTLSEIEPYVVALTGTGVFNAVPQITLSATRLGFGNRLTGVPASAQVVITNVGQVPVVIESVLASGDFFVNHSCGLTIAVASTCTLDVSFYPRTTGAHLGGVEIRTNAAGSPHGVQVSGVGCAFPSIARARFGRLVCGP